MEPMITAPPVPRGILLHRRDTSSGSFASASSSSALDTCGYLSGDYASPLTCGLGYTCSTGPSLIPSHLGCCNAVNCAPSSGAHTCITAESGRIPCTGTSSTACIEQYTSLLFCTDATAPACVTYSQPPPSSGSLANAGFSPTIFSYACGPTQTTRIYLATATNAPPSASSASPHHGPSFTHLPIGAYVGIGIGALIVLSILTEILRRCQKPKTVYVYQSPNPGTVVFPPKYHCRHCGSRELSYRTVQWNNPNGNFPRQYCVCTNQQCRNVRNSRMRPEMRGWVSWLDDIGVHETNAPCWCGKPSRLDYKGWWSSDPGTPFNTCSTGACNYPFRGQS